MITKTRTYEQYLEECFKAQAKYNRWRIGQTLFNVLSEQRPDLSIQVQGTDLDPFYLDCTRPSVQEKIDMYLRWVKDNW